MELHSECHDPVTPSVSYSNSRLWRHEDSGYHTSFTPGSIDRSEISIDTDPIYYSETPGLKFSVSRKYRPKSTLSIIESPSASPVRRGVKRTYYDEEVSYNTIPTPTSMIAGGIQKLRVSENTKPSKSSIRSENSHNTLDLYNLEYAQNLSYPTTPIKKVCRTSCKLSPIKKSGKKLNFTIHSLSCTANGLLPVVKHRPHSKVVRTITFKPEQKVDIIGMLYENAKMPPLDKIFSYLCNEDVYNLKLVSNAWCQIWNEVSYQKVKHDYYNYLKLSKENQENKNKGVTPMKTNATQRSLKEVHNILNTQIVRDTARSPPGTPRTNKFKKFTKSASLDSRPQILCVRCSQPAKVTRESSGEEWAECTSVTCSYQYCTSCSCNRHPGKSCIIYGIDDPSPSKRKKTTCAVGSKKSKKHLRRLLL